MPQVALPAAKTLYGEAAQSPAPGAQAKSIGYSARECRLPRRSWAERPVPVPGAAWRPPARTSPHLRPHTDQA